MASGKFGTAINCIDDRAQAPVSDWIKENHSVDYVDTITEPGSDKVLLEVDYFFVTFTIALFINWMRHMSRFDRRKPNQMILCAILAILHYS